MPRDRIAPAVVRPRVLPAVPLRIERGVPEPVGARKIDDDRTGGRLERRRPLVAETEEQQLGARGPRGLVRDEGRQRAVQPDVERRGRLTGERVRAERHDLELRMAEHAVEGLLARIS